jgi:hypothetical protein
MNWTRKYDTSILSFTFNCKGSVRHVASMLDSVDQDIYLTSRMTDNPVKVTVVRGRVLIVGNMH